VRIKEHRIIELLLQRHQFSAEETEMKQFVAGSDSDFLALENRAQGKCIRFKNQEFPEECSPSNGNIGFEVNEKSNAATLFVSPGITYTGQIDSLGEWFGAGVKTFRSFDVLKEWFRSDIRLAFNTAVSNSSPEETDRETEVPDITDFNAVREGLPEQHTGSVYIDEPLLLETLSKKVKGQNSALKTLSKVVTHHLARKNPSRPAVVFSVGPSGVGKTKTAESLSEAIQEIAPEGGEYQYLRLDMTEYQEAHRVSQLIGSPQGYVGHGEGSQFIDTLQANPQSIVLFDEIEKAHPSILRLLMNTMDAGRISSASRRGGEHQVDCRHAIFVFTSNLDAEGILADVANTQAQDSQIALDQICRKRLNASGIPPEIIGRIGRFLIYFPLSRNHRAEIMAISVKEIAEEYGVTLVYVSPTIVIELMKRLGDSGFGARPAKYLIDDELGSVCASAAKANVNSIKILGPPYSYEAVH
jgi:ATP-dependent Clp protease ATP-binding subunit ClpA